MQELITFILNIVLWLPRAILSLFTDTILLLWSYIPDPGFGDYVAIVANFISLPQIQYFSELFHFRDGIAIVFTARIAKFILRRIPGIG
jgi:hypothetical protein